MYSPKSIGFFSILLLVFSIAHSQENNFSKLRGNGLMFTQNSGQIVDMENHLRPDVLFKGSASGTDIYLRKTGISYVMSNIGAITDLMNLKAEEARKNGKKYEGESLPLKAHRVDIDFENCNPTAEVVTREQTEGYKNFYYAHCPDGILGVKSYNEILIKNIYNNIDIKYYGSSTTGLKYDLIVNPGASANDIKIKYSGAENLRVESSRLKVESSLGEIIEWMPRVYQNINGNIVDIDATYKLSGTTLSFELGTYNLQFPLIIDPWVSYFGGSGRDVGRSVTTDPSGNVIFTGFTSSVDLPVSTGAFQTYFGGYGNAFYGAGDAFVTKMDVNGNLLWSTYYGGTSDDQGGYGITTDANGNVILTGYTTSANFPIGASGANTVHQNTYNNCTSCYFMGDAYVIKLDQNGQRLFATYYGGSGDEKGLDIVTDGNNIYLYGITNSTSNISTTGSFQPTLRGSYDVFISKFTPTGTRSWATYVGGTRDDNYGNGGGIACDPITGNIFISSTTTSPDFPVLSGLQMTKTGFYDIVMCSFNATGTQLWGTYYGGTGFQGNSDITVDRLGDVILIGTTSSSGMATPGAYQITYGGGFVDLIVAKFGSAGNKKWATYLGGTNGEYGASVATDDNNNIYIYAEFEDGDAMSYPISVCAYQPTFGGMEDQFIAKYDANGIQRCITYIGGTGEDELENNDGSLGGAGGIAIHGNNLYITGVTGNGYPTTANAFQSVKNGVSGSEAYIDQLCVNLCEAKNLGLDFSSATNVCVNSAVGFTSIINNSCDTTGYTYQWSFPGGTPSSSTAKNPVVLYTNTGSYDVKLVLTTLCKSDSIIKTNYLNVTAPTINIVGNNIICNGTSATLTANGATSYLWSNGPTTASINVNPIATTSYSVVGVDANGCTNMITTTVTVASPPLITINGPTTVCNGSTVLLTASGASSYLWSTTNTTMSISVSPASPTAYTVTGTDANGCTGTATTSVSVNSSPVVIINSPTSVCAGNTISLSAAGANSYLWNNSSVSSSITVSPSTMTSYSVTGTDVNGCTAIASTTINVNQPPAITIAGPTTICNGNTVSLSANGANNYTWNTLATTSTISVNPNSTTTYSVMGTDANGCSATAVTTVTVNSVPSINISGPSVICNGNSVSLTANGGNTYLWSNASISNPIVVSPTNTTSYSVTGTSANGCSNTASVTINVSQTPIINIAGPGTICAGVNIILSASGANNYLWNTNATTNNIQVSPLATTSFSVIGTNAGGCTATAFFTLSVSPAPVVNFTANDSMGCGPLCISFNDPANFPIANWKFSDGYFTNGNSINHCFSNSGLFSVSLTVTDNNGCSATLIKNNYINVYANPFADFAMNPQPATTMIPIAFTDLSVNATSWQWTFGDALNGYSTLQNPNYIYPDSGNYSVRLIVTNEYGCSDTADKLLIVNPEFSFYAPNTFTPNGDGLNDLFSLEAVGISSEHYNLFLFDRWGNLIWEGHSQDEKWDGRASALAGGGAEVVQEDTYVWVLKCEDLNGIKHRFTGHLNVIK